MINIAVPGAFAPRRLACLAAASTALALSACTPPPHAAVVKCSASNFADADVKKDCDIRIERFHQYTSATIRIDSRRRHAFVRGTFTVEEGTARIELRGAAGTEAEAFASPGSPAQLEGTLRLSRPDNEFHLRFHPDGEVGGLRGAVHYEAR